MILFVTESVGLITPGSIKASVKRLAEQRSGINLSVTDGHHGWTHWLLLSDIFTLAHLGHAIVVDPISHKGCLRLCTSIRVTFQHVSARFRYSCFPSIVQVANWLNLI